MGENVEGAGWEIVRPPPDAGDPVESIDDLIPEAPWLWYSLQRFCVPDCCGLDAYDLSHASVRWACGDDVDEPAEDSWRDPEPGDPSEMAAALRRAAAAVRSLTSAKVRCDVFGEILTPESLASLLDDLATKLETPLPAPG